MRYSYLILLYLLTSLCLACNPKQATLLGSNEASVAAPRRVVLKLDDLAPTKAGGIHPGWSQAMDFLNSRGVVGTMGLIGESLEDPSPEYITWIKARHAEGHEIWNHGYCHCRAKTPEEGDWYEFKGLPYAEQLAALTRTQTLAREQLGFAFTSFGAPFNATDSATAAAIATLPELKVWMWKETAAPTTVAVLPRVPDLNIEEPVHVPDYEAFVRGWRAHPELAVVSIQGHPRSWTAEPQRMRDFERIVDFLLAEGAVFVTPSRAYGGFVTRP